MEYYRKVQKNRTDGKGELFKTSWSPMPLTGQGNLLRFINSRRQFTERNPGRYQDDFAEVPYGYDVWYEFVELPD